MACIDSKDATGALILNVFRYLTARATKLAYAIVVVFALLKATIAHTSSPLSAYAASAKTSRPATLYSQLLPSLRHGTTVPILLPSNLSAYAGTPLYASIEQVTSSSYSINIDGEPTCRGATACNFCYVTGSRITSTHVPLLGTAITLSNGTKAYYVGTKCYASCGMSTVTWRTGRYQYSLGIKGRLEKIVIDAANSMKSY